MVCGIERKPNVINAFIHAVINKTGCVPSFREYYVDWNFDKGSYKIEQCSLDSTEKENLLTKDLEIPYVTEVLKELVASQRLSPIYCLDNMQFVECQLSLDSLDSPTDSLSISLSHNCHNIIRL